MYGTNPQTSGFAKWRVDEIDAGSELLLEHVLNLYNNNNFPLPDVSELFDLSVHELGFPPKEASIVVDQCLSENRNYFKAMGYSLGLGLSPGSINFEDAKSVHPALYKHPSSR